MDSPIVGVGVLVVRDGKILLGKRKQKHGEDQWAPPGGHLRFREEPVDCARRKLLEETGLVMYHGRAGPWVSNYFEDSNKHYVSIFVLCNIGAQEAINTQADKCHGWEWFDIDSIPEPRFPSLESLLKGCDLKHLVMTMQ